MFDRSNYKKIARLQLHGRYKVPVISYILNMAVFFIIFAGDFISNDFSDLHFSKSGSSFSLSCDYDFIFVIAACIFLGIVNLAFTRVFIALFHTKEPITMAEFFKGIEHFVTGALSALWFTLWVFLWSMLFFIPGIVKAYSYSMMFFILAENPGVGVNKAMKLSKTITRGFKSELFIMSLSFLPWIILSSITGFLLNLWLVPYMNMSFTNAYQALKARAIRIGDLKPEDFN